MITETIQFTNFNDEPGSMTMHFHISEAVLVENLTIRDRLEAMKDILEGDVRQLSMAEIQEIVDIVKFFMSISYGIKSPDGSKFDQDHPVVGSGPIWHDFQSSPAYSAFLMSLFKVPEKSVQFITNVLPAELRAQTLAEAENNPQLKAFLEGAEKAARPAPGTRIVDDYTLAANAERPVTEAVPEVDYDAMLSEMDQSPATEPEPEKLPITRQQRDHMRARLNDTQFEHFMSTRVLVED